MWTFIIGTTLTFIAGSLLAVATRLYYKDKIFLMQEDWLDALRKQREAAYTEGYEHGMSDEKIVQAAKKQYRKDVIRRSLPDNDTHLIPVIR